MITFISILINILGALPLVLFADMGLEYGPHSAGLMTLIPFFVMLSDVLERAKKNQCLLELFLILLLVIILLNIVIYFTELIFNGFFDQMLRYPLAHLLFSVIVYPALRLAMSVACFKIFKSKTSRIFV